MRTVIVYESMYGNTRVIAECIGEGVGATAGPGEDEVVVVVPAHDLTPDQAAGADLLVVGAPTHVHGLPRPVTRQGAVEQADGLPLEPRLEEDGVREWLAATEPADGRLAAAFDTRVDIWPVLSGRASRVIARLLRRHGYRLVLEPESFLVDRTNHLRAPEADRAVTWGTALAVAARAARAEQPVPAPADEAIPTSPS